MKRLTLTLLLICISALPSRAFDTGYHWDATAQGMQAAGYSAQNITIAQISNWLVDYYSNAPSAPKAVKHQLELLHFDNLNDKALVDWTWGHLIHNFTEALNDILAKPQTDANTTKALALIGYTLHTVQDFYTHSNWASAFPKIGSAYASQTYLSEGTAPDGTQSGYYPKPGDCRNDCNGMAHGGYFAGENKDSQIRPDWDEAYAFAYLDTRRFLLLVDQLVADSTYDLKTYAITEPAITEGLPFDEQAADFVSMWIKAGADADGHWKGNLSGSKSNMAKFILRWTASTDSYLVWLVKDHQFQRPLAHCLFMLDKPDGCDDPPAVPLQNFDASTVQVIDAKIHNLSKNDNWKNPETDAFMSTIMFQGATDWATWDRVLWKIRSFVAQNAAPPSPAARTLYFRTAGGPQSLSLGIANQPNSGTATALQSDGNTAALALIYDLQGDQFSSPDHPDWGDRAAGDDNVYTSNGDQVSYTFSLSQGSFQ